jgi:hypothetical protein
VSRVWEGWRTRLQAVIGQHVVGSDNTASVYCVGCNGSTVDRQYRQDETHLFSVLRRSPTVISLVHAGRLGITAFGAVRVHERLELFIPTHLDVVSPKKTPRPHVLGSPHDPIQHTFIFLLCSSDHLSIVILRMNEMCTPKPTNQPDRADTHWVMRSFAARTGEAHLGAHQNTPDR